MALNNGVKVDPLFRKTMSDSNNKKKKKRVSIKDDDDDEDRHQKLAELGALPPSEDDDEFVRDVEVMSEIPEIDTTRADEPPRRVFRALLWMIMIPIVLLVCFAFTIEFLYLIRTTNCSFNDMMDEIATFDTTEIEKSFWNLYSHCFGQR